MSSSCMRMSYEASWCGMAAAKPLGLGTDSWEPKSRNRMFILGMGFVGHFFAQQLKSQGWDVSGTCTSILKKKQLEDRGFDIYHFDANQPEWSILDVLNCHTHLLVSIPPFVGIGDPMFQHEELLKNGLVDGNLRWLCYLSSTSVYGNSGGKWVDEEFPASPTSELAKLRLAAEKRWLDLGHTLGIEALVFRLGGIYGLGRSAVDTIIKQEALSEGQRRRTQKLYTSRVHVEDVCQALKASNSASFPGKVFNIVDDDPAPREEVFAYARNLIEKKWPGQIKWSAEKEDALVTVKKGCLFAEKRVSNARMKNELGVRLIHPNYRLGLQSIIDQMENPFQNSFR
ncbi:NAD(P)-binding domain containing protein [Trema orientale]|uniref:NAD(P)-binding domain containing protein n=1 Tax=Trema orientale TaxID=63057 RepID=A0A2P5EZK9_TREOI|nr:NAD(P)-binding domain containing protein [Trema orientale]